MKKIITLVLLLSFAAQAFSQGITLLSFYINRSYIAANQCENRFRPMLHCNGKCVLAKKMKQQEKKESRDPERKLQNKYEVVSSRSFFTTTVFFLVSLNTSYAELAIANETDRSFSVFHPPC